MVDLQQGFSFRAHSETHIHYISKEDPKAVKAYDDIRNILKEVQDLVRKEFTFRYDVVGNPALIIYPDQTDQLYLLL